MAITGVSSISGQQIIAAGALSAASAGTALYDENGNPITGYLTAVPTGYATSGDITGTAQYGLTTAGWSEITGGGSLTGDYVSGKNVLQNTYSPYDFTAATVSGDVSVKRYYDFGGSITTLWNYSLSSIGNSVSNNSGNWQKATGTNTLIEYNDKYEMFNSAYKPSITDYTQNNVEWYDDSHCMINVGNIANEKITFETDSITATGYDDSFFQPGTSWLLESIGDGSATYVRNFKYTGKNSDFISINNPGYTNQEVWYKTYSGVELKELAFKDDITGGASFPASAEEACEAVTANSATWNGKQDALTFGYNASNAISSINESAIAAGGATYSNTDNGLISAIDSSGLYATSGSANHLNLDGTMGGNITQVKGASTFYYMPSVSPWTTADVATGIFSPLQYATGACLAMNDNYFKAYFKGNEWFVCNTYTDQMLRGETHQSRGVHITGATTAGNGFNLGINGVSGINDTAKNYNWILQRGYVSGKGVAGEWKYGPSEDAALRAVSSCDMHESAFEYDASDNITGYNGSAFAGGGSLPASAEEACEAVTANSGAWGGSALPISAGPGIALNLVDGVLVISTAGAGDMGNLIEDDY